MLELKACHFFFDFIFLLLFIWVALLVYKLVYLGMLEEASRGHPSPEVAVCEPPLGVGNPTTIL